MTTVRLTMAQALLRYLMAQKIPFAAGRSAEGAVPLIPAVWAIFGHGNVAGMGAALYQQRQVLPTLRAHNEQAMALAAVAYAKARRRRQFMACTTSIGPGATNMVTAAALAHVNRLPVLLLPGDVFASRAPDPVLQQIEHFGEPGITVNDCFRPVSRFFDRITRPEQLLASLPRALQVLTDPAECGPVTLALPQDVQAMAYDYPASFFDEQLHRRRRPGPDLAELQGVREQLLASARPLIVAGGGVHYSDAGDTLVSFAAKHGIPVAETQAGKGTIAWDHPLAVGSIGVTGSSAANELAADADLVLAIGTRLQDFTTASRTLLAGPLIGLNVCAFDSGKHGARPLLCDARRGLVELDAGLDGWHADERWVERAGTLAARWRETVDAATSPRVGALPSDAEVIGAVNRAAGEKGIVVCAAGGLPGELHKLWRSRANGDYHVEYGYSCMGYEIAGGLGVKMASPERDVYVMVGDGSYLMMNSEIATSVMLGHKLIVVVLDNHGFGCIHRLQQACGGEPFNNLWRDSTKRASGAPGIDFEIDFAAHARSLGATAQRVASIGELEAALRQAGSAERTSVIVIETDPDETTTAGGAWWDVAVPEVPDSEAGERALSQYAAALSKRRWGERR